jgi:hypothetical protein
MGGMLTRLSGQFDESKKIPIPLEKTLLDRILFRQRYEKPIRQKFQDFTYIKIQNTQLSNEITKKFISFLNATISIPSEATKAILDYLLLGVMSTAITGEEKNDKTDWFVSFSFSGCAGMAEISAELCCHWVERWFEAKSDELIPIFKSANFECSKINFDNPQNYSFMEVGTRKHGFYSSLFPEEDGSVTYEVDGSVYETFDGFEEEDFEEKFQSKMRATYGNNKMECKCQLCSPEFIQNLTLSF